MTAHHHTMKTLFDFAALGITAGAIIKLLPAVAAAFSIVWTAIRIFETKTVQRWLGKGSE